jgi:hypothetical protein
MRSDDNLLVILCSQPLIDGAPVERLREKENDLPRQRETTNFFL